jgi:dTDP-3,4-didehydro-2,6-dideoxy-alpha-D-glucose 3-reductase
MPALQRAENKAFFAGIAIASPTEWFGNLEGLSEVVISEQQNQELNKAKTFINDFGGRIYNSYLSLVTSSDIDALYIPLPPALHYKWAKIGLMNGKHVFIEKPSTIKLTDTKDLITIAAKNDLVLHENYMFVFHKQLDELQEVVRSGEIGEVRLYRISFGFPRRSIKDFRYIKELGGGALLDAGGYTFKYASFLLGETAKMTTAQANYVCDFDVEIFGSATMVNHDGLTAQLAFGMDNDYKCDIEIWGSKGTIIAGRVLTAPVGFTPTYTIKKNQHYETRNLSEDDAFLKSIERFIDCVNDGDKRQENYILLERQESFVDQFRKLSGFN